MSDGFQPWHDGWDDLRRLWQRPKPARAAAAPAPQDPLPVVESPPLAPVALACGGVIPKSDRLWLIGAARLPAMPPLPPPFNPRAALRRMADAGVPDPLFAALYRAHPEGPPPDVDPRTSPRTVHMAGRG